MFLVLRTMIEIYGKIFKYHNDYFLFFHFSNKRTSFLRFLRFLDNNIYKINYELKSAFQSIFRQFLHPFHIYFEAVLA